MTGEWMVYATDSRAHAAMPVTVAHFVPVPNAVPLCGRELRRWPKGGGTRPAWGANDDESARACSPRPRRAMAELRLTPAQKRILIEHLDAEALPPDHWRARQSPRGATWKPSETLRDLGLLKITADRGEYGILRYTSRLTDAGREIARGLRHG
jgi:hypothetical protein